MSLTFLIVGFVLVAVGLGALILGAAFRARGGVRMLLAFGSFAVIYGLSLLMRSHALEQFGLSPTVALHILWQTNYWSSIPALIYTEEARGQGWYRSLRVMWIAWIPLAITLTIVDIITGRPGSWSALYLPFILLMQLTILAHLVWGEATYVESRRLQRFGGIVFLVSILFDNIVGIVWPVSTPRLEPLGVAAFIGSLAVATVRQFFARERELAAVESEMRTARDIQESILPSTELTLSGLRIAARYLPMRGIAGDLYDFHAIDDHRVGVLVADVTGHGVPAALIASMVKVAFSAERERAGEPAALLTGMNRTLCGHLAGQFVTAAYVFFDTERQMLRYSIAGHPPPILRRASGEQIGLAKHAGYFLGFDSTATYGDAGLELQNRDRVLLYTDGLTEAEDRSGRTFGDIRLGDVLARGAGESAQAFAALLLSDVRSWSGHRGNGHAFDDDLTFVIVDINKSI